MVISNRTPAWFRDMAKGAIARSKVTYGAVNYVTPLYPGAVEEEQRALAEYYNNIANEIDTIDGKVV